MSTFPSDVDAPVRAAVAALEPAVAERVLAKLAQLEHAKLQELVALPAALDGLVDAVAKKAKDAIAKEKKKANKAKLKEVAALPRPPNASRTLNINVGVLGHVDSGKTSLTRALSTVGSTASFDKHPQSKERGITLDLGFSSFMMDLPEHLKAAGAPYDNMQVTLVDCPGHASLIRTIIGGAQIIDLMMLVVDVGKGIQTQTAECLVIGEITNDSLIVVLNKVDTLPAATRDADLDKVKARIAKTLSTTKFANAPMRDPDGPLLFAIDHCFPIKGQGTVLTGTVLSGQMKVGMEIDFPELKQQRKVKSMQMFKKPVQHVWQGDRVGVCVTQLDAKSLERGIACTHGHVTLISNALISVRQIRFFKGACKTGSKFHFTVGHTTVMVTATFFGPARPEGASKPKAEAGVAITEEQKAVAVKAAVELARTPLRTSFDHAAEYAYQDELDAEDPDQWAVLQFEQPVPCALPQVGIASHLDAATTSATCRLAFHGLMLQSLSRDELRSLRIFKRKFKEGQIERVQDERTVICKALFQPGTDMNLFVGMQVQLGEAGPLGRIEGTFGKTKFKCVFPETERGVEGLQDACHRAKLLLKYKRFVFDETKKMIQTGA